MQEEEESRQLWTDLQNMRKQYKQRKCLDGERASVFSRDSPNRGIYTSSHHFTRKTDVKGYGEVEFNVYSLEPSVVHPLHVHV